MKKIFLLFLLISFLFPNLGKTAVVNHFVPKYPPTIDDIDVSYKKKGLKAGWEFGVFDFGGDPSEGIVLLKGGYKPRTTSFVVEKINGFNILKVIEGFNKGATLNLGKDLPGNGPEFSFFMKYNDTYYTDLDIKDLGCGIYLFSYKPPFQNKTTGSLSEISTANSSSDSGYVIGFDLQAVPIPSSLLLLFSGILGIIFISIRSYPNNRKSM